jgi:DNA-directed RNA polymerase specialized sigma24 family protein
MAQVKGQLTEEIPKHRILREIFRHYIEFREYVGHTGHHVIDHGYFIYNDDGTVKQKISVTISFWDLMDGLKDLSPRKREAVWYNVILDQKQRDVAKLMKITTVSVGQYVEQAMKQLSERYFADDTIILNGVVITKPAFVDDEVGLII